MVSSSSYSREMAKNRSRGDKAKSLIFVIFTREKSDILRTKSDQLEWRRSKVVEMRAD
jgi:hypothetical protein